LPYGFSATLRGNLDHSNSNRRSYGNPLIGDGAASNGRLLEYAYQTNTYTFNQIINWERDFGIHHVDAMLGHENYSWNRRYTFGMNTNAVVENNFTIGNFVNTSELTGQDDVDRTESYLGRVRYNYDNKYFADFSYRRDGSSRFADGHRWGDFFSFGLNWDAKRENFFKDIKWISQLRAHASYGEVGNNMAVGYYAYKALYAIAKNSGNGALIKQSLAANNIKWETTQTVDFGVEGQLFNRLNFSLAYFDKRSKDLLFEVRLPLSAGSYPYSDNVMNLTQYENIGTISNRGLELSLNGDVIRTKDWTWNLATEGTFIKNKIVKLPGGKDILHGVQNYSEGHDAYEFYTYHFEGVDQMTGNSLYTIDPKLVSAAEAAGTLVNINGKNYTTDTSYGQKVWAGTALPTYYGSFTSNLKWKDLSLMMMFTYSLGGKVYDASYQNLMSTNSAASAGAYHKDLANSWNGIPEGMTETSANRIAPNGIPVLDFDRSTNNNATSDRWLTSASYFVFKNLNLTYDLPKTWIKNLGLSAVSVNAGVENLFTVTSRKGLNPQYSFTGGSDDTYVTARVFNFGLSVNF
jgi:TonB-linked SusC/RagA family outer membrane protein